MSTKRPPRYETLPTDAPIWVSEPFRVFFPLGIAAGIFGLLLWPLHHAGWWALYPGIQHPRILTFGFGSAFVFGFLGTAWPRFLEASALRRWELLALVAAWVVAQAGYARGAIASGDLAAGIGGLFLLLVLGRRFFGRESRDLPPPGFALAFLSVAMATAVLLLWAVGMGQGSSFSIVFTRLLAYQGFLLFPILGVGSYLFGRFFQVPGRPPAMAKPRFRAAAVWGCALVILVSFVVEALGWTRLGNGIRIAGFGVWVFAAAPALWRERAPGTRAWALRVGLALMPLAFFGRILMPAQLFPFEHLLFLGGFTLVLLVTADRVVVGHCDDPARIPPRSMAWRWIVWLVVVGAATRATADLVPSTRVSHQIYAAVTAAGVLVAWLCLHARRLKRSQP